MTSIVLRLAAPLQGWGSDSDFLYRDVATRPTKSGLLGMIAAALGRDAAEDPIDDLSSLRMGVRVDIPGIPVVDYQSISSPGGMPRANGKHTDAGETRITWRGYIADAAYLAVLSGPAATITDIAYALRRPIYTLSLGRRKCPPTEPVTLGTENSDDLRELLHSTPWLGNGYAPPEPVEIVYDDPAGALRLNDVPISYHPRHRLHGWRSVTQEWITLPC